MSLCMTPAGVITCVTPVGVITCVTPVGVNYHPKYDSCRNQVSLCMTPAEVKYLYV